MTGPLRGLGLNDRPAQGPTPSLKTSSPTSLSVGANTDLRGGIGDL